VRRYHGIEVADQEQEWFIDVMLKHNTPPEMPEIQVEPGAQPALELVKRFFGGQKSHGALRRLFEQGAISLNAHVLRQAEQVVELQDGDVVRVGKRTWFRLRVDRSRVIG
jgi:tyrosyl-tRNA synthetase